ncbi:MAG: glycosyltransferase family 2 protein [Planctomycetota bacterium]
MLTVIVPNYNGRQILERCLPHTLQAAERVGAEVIVVDDASTDDSVAFLEERFPMVRLVRHAENRGFGEACRSGVEAADTELVALVNSDVMPEADCFEKLISPFEGDERLFAVSAVSVYADNGEQYEHLKIPYLKHGHFRFKRAGGRNPETSFDPDRVTARTATFFATGGHAVYRRRVFLELGGFDPIYRPAYLEDVDLSYRAWKRGYRIELEPGAKVRHERKGSLSERYGDRALERLVYRNRLIFSWSNFTDRGFLLRHHLLPMGVRCLTRIFAGDLEFYRILFQALPYRKACRERRHKERAAAVRSDAEVFRIVQEAYSGIG